MRYLILVISCTSLVTSTADAAEYRLRFRDVAREAGLATALAGIMGHGAACGDFNGDGRVDIFVGGFCDRPDAEYKPATAPVPSRLFRNEGNGTFSLIKDTPAQFYGRTSGAVFADLDNDGWLDLYVANNAKGKGKKSNEPQASALTRSSMLFHNQRGIFKEISQSSGACPAALRTARNIGVLDYNRDGKLDLFVIEDKFTTKPRSALFRNDGGMAFTDMTRDVGLPEDIFGLGLAVADLNGDGDPDLFVPHSNRLFLSTSKATYREVIDFKDTLGWKPAHGEDWPCGACFADLNRDGKLDLVLSIHGIPARNRVYLNDGLKDGIPQFRDITREAGLGDPVPVRCPHVEVQDFDNDGWPDIYLSAGWLDADGNVTPLIFQHMGVNDKLPRFVSPRQIKEPMVYFPAGPTLDFDGDGRLDLFLVNWFQGNACRLMHNQTKAGGWLRVEVIGKTMNRMGIGALVSIYRAGEAGQAAALLGYQEISTGYGYASGQVAQAHFGLGTTTEVDLIVHFPGGKKQTRSRVKAGQLLKITEE